MFGITEFDKIMAVLLALTGTQSEPDGFPGLADGGRNADFPVTVQPCPRPLGRHEIEGKTIICGTVSVPENHAQKSGQRIDIVFTVLKSHSMYPEPDPVVHLHGGPGGGLLGGLENFAVLFDKWRANRDIVMFDQRAAGLSAGSTDCYEAMTANLTEIIGAKIEIAEAEDDKAPKKNTFNRCIDELKENGVGLKYYNTEQNAKDVTAIVDTLGYDTFNLYGISYGTKLSLEVMRQKPAGLRAVVLDGVAPPSIRLYDTLAVPQNEAMVALVNECKADEACNSAYPDLAGKINKAFENAAAGKIKHNGETMPPSIVAIVIGKRNGNYKYASYTKYLPAAIAEMAKAEKTPTLGKIVETLKKENGDIRFAFNRVGPSELRQAAKTERLNDEEKRLLEIALINSSQFKAGGTAMDLAIDEFKNALRRHRELGPLAELFDAEMIKASGAILSDKKLLVAVLKDYAALQNVTPSKQPLHDLVNKHFDGSGELRLNALIDAMTETEVKTLFGLIRSSVSRVESKFAGNAHLMIYACQEDLPHNSLAGYKELTASLDFPQLGLTQWDASAKNFYETCEQFEASPRPGFHEPVVSDIPTLSLGSTWDVQTAASWAEVAVETLPNGQAFIIPEAGHAAIVYQECAIDMGVAFINNPERKLGNQCAESIKPSFYIAPWVKK